MRAGPGAKQAILEAFKPGTAPPGDYSVVGYGDANNGGSINRSWSAGGVSPDADRAVRYGHRRAVLTPTSGPGVALGGPRR